MQEESTQTGLKARIMGILNVTPDSFSDGGKFIRKKQQLTKIKELIEHSDIIDVGGESSGPGSQDVSAEEEFKRVIPAIKEIRKISNIPISIDSYKSEIVEEAFRNGANIINDVTALRGDEKMAKIAAKLGCPICLMYSKDNSARTTVKEQTYTDIIKSLSNFFTERLKVAREAGIKESNIILDPGMGQFISSRAKFSFEIIARLRELKSFKKEILIGISRKSFLGGKIEERDKISLPITAIAYLNGASIIRTHDPKGTREYLTKL